MTMKCCTGCMKVKDLELFDYESKKAGKRRAMCKLCRSETRKIVREKTARVSNEVAYKSAGKSCMPTPIASWPLYVPNASKEFVRNSGHKDIKSRGIG